MKRERERKKINWCSYACKTMFLLQPILQLRLPTIESAVAVILSLLVVPSSQVGRGKILTRYMDEITSVRHVSV